MIFVIALAYMLRVEGSDLRAERGSGLWVCLASVKVVACTRLSLAYLLPSACLLLSGDESCGMKP